MSAKDAISHRRPSRKLSKRRREPGMISLPDRFRSDDEYDVQEEDSDARPGLPFMHQSVFGVIAAAQSKEDFQSVMNEDDSEGDSQDEAGAMPSDITAAEPSSQSSLAGSSAPKPKKRLSEHKLLRSLPGLRTRHTKDKEPNRGSSPLSSPALDSHDTSGDAPIMSQMLRARAQAESLESSNATLTARNSSSSTSLKSARKAPVALPEALKDIFQFDQPEEVISEYPCWYLANVLLQGYMYITQRHVCFYAYLQQKSNTTIKSGHLAKRGKTNPHFRRYWFTLKGTVFSYFVDPSTPYFPSGNIDLRYGISADLEKSKDPSKDSSFFSVTTDKRTYQFKADSFASAKEWVKQLQKVIFRSHNDGDSVKISLPIDNILDIEENPVIDSAETVKIRVIDNDETFAVDEYFFSFFSFGTDALNVLKIMTQDTSASKALAGHTGRDSHPPGGVSVLKEEAGVRPPIKLTVSEIYENVKATVPPAHAATSPRASFDVTRSSLDVGRSSMDRSRSSFDRPQRSTSAASRVSFEHSRPRARSPLVRTFGERPSSPSTVDGSAPPSIMAESGEQSSSDLSGSRILSGSDGFTSTLAASSTKRKPDSPRLHSKLGSAEVSASSSRTTSRERAEIRSRLGPRMYQDEGAKLTAEPAQMPQYPTRTSTDAKTGVSYSESLMRAGTYPIQTASGLAGILRDQGRRMSSIFTASPKGYYEKVYGMWAGGKKHYGDADGLQGEDYVYDPDEESDTAQAEARFRDYFALPASEKLVASYFSHIMRVLPLYGKIYIGSTRLCFRSLLPGTRTKFVIPFKDILNVDKEKGFRFGYSGMVVVIRGHEEIFFEFNAAGLRDDCTVTILKSLETIKLTMESLVIGDEEKAEADRAADEHMRLQAARKDGYAEHDLQLTRDLNELDRSAPTILFDDPQASLLDFKPTKSLNITCLTIGSRGDVQPYIALCKGFIAEGHKAKIATHAEFEPWVRKHGIDFAPVEGDPAELMRICVENGMFTPSFLYEANSKFRGFLDTLLTTAWTACQGAEVLIESPSAMAGIHIAEALGVPYFRAFTMPWTRTRAYPHAFAVPNHKMGGAYNYMTYVLFDNIFWQATAGQINRWRRKDLNLRPTTLDRLQPNKVPFLYNFSPSVVVPPLDFSDWIRVTGYWFLDEATTWEPPAPLLAFIARARADNVPLVYIGFGSVVVSDSRLMTEAIVKAVQKADVRCILSKGWSDRLDTTVQKSVPEIPLPDSIFPITAAPHDWLFSQIDCAVHHGGAGTTGASLRAGVPTIIKPFFGDQFFFGARVQDLGVGICIKKVGESQLGKALWIATHDARMRSKAKVLGEQIRAEDGVGNAIKAVYRDLEYARTLVGRRRRVRHGEPAGEDGDEDDEGDAGAEDQVEGTESWTFVDEDERSRSQSEDELGTEGARAGDGRADEGKGLRRGLLSPELR